MASYNPDLHHRRSIRLKGHDYTQPGAYFVTIAAWQRECLFGEIVDGVVLLNTAGNIIHTEWLNLPHHFPDIRLEAFMVMPNHFHGIIVIDPIVGATRLSPDDVRVNDDGSPLRIPRGSRVLVGATRQLPVGATHPSIVGATHPLQDIDTDGNDPTPDQARIGADGSPLRMPARDYNDGSPRPSVHPNGPPAGSLGAMIGQFKSRATKRIWMLPGVDRRPIWQRNYYEHVIRNDLECQRFIQYIQTNPQRWQEDQLHPSALLNPYNQE